MGPRRYSRSESRRGWLHGVQGLRRHHRGVPGLGAHGGPAVHEQEQERREIPQPHHQAETRAASSQGPRATWQPRRLGAEHHGKGRERTRETGGGGQGLGEAGGGRRAEGGAGAGPGRGRPQEAGMGAGLWNAGLGQCEASGHLGLVNPACGFQADCGTCLKNADFQVPPRDSESISLGQGPGINIYFFFFQGSIFLTNVLTQPVGGTEILGPTLLKLLNRAF